MLLTGAIVLVDTMFFAALTPLLRHYVDEFDLGKSGAGVLQAMFPAGALVAGIPAGIAAARFGVKPTVLIEPESTIQAMPSNGTRASSTEMTRIMSFSAEVRCQVKSRPPD